MVGHGGASSVGPGLLMKLLKECACLTHACISLIGPDARNNDTTEWQAGIHKRFWHSSAIVDSVFIYQGFSNCAGFTHCGPWATDCRVVGSLCCQGTSNVRMGMNRLAIFLQLVSHLEVQLTKEKVWICCTSSAYCSCYTDMYPDQSTLVGQYHVDPISVQRHFPLYYWVEL